MLGGKTLQEKLAEKKKEQLKKNMEAEAHNTDAFIKSLNLPNIPSTLTLSKATIATTTGNIPSSPKIVSKTSPAVLKSHKLSSNISSKYSLEISRPTTAGSYPIATQSVHIPLSKPVSPAPTFPAESGISINQVCYYLDFNINNSGVMCKYVNKYFVNDKTILFSNSLISNILVNKGFNDIEATLHWGFTTLFQNGH